MFSQDFNVPSLPARRRRQARRHPDGGIALAGFMANCCVESTMREACEKAWLLAFEEWFESEKNRQQKLELALRKKDELAENLCRAGVG